MTYAALSVEQKAILQTFCNDVRAESSVCQKAFSRWVALQARRVGQIDAILAVLDAGEIIPNTSGLAGAQGLPATADMMSIVSDLDNMVTTHNVAAKQQRRARACGNTNV